MTKQVVTTLRMVPIGATVALRIADSVDDGQVRDDAGAARAARAVLAEPWEVGRLMVAPDLSGHGIGRWLLAYAERQAPGTTTTVVLTTGARSERNLELYRRAGYRPDPGQPTGTVRLTKPRGVAAA